MDKVEEVPRERDGTDFRLGPMDCSIDRNHRMTICAIGTCAKANLYESF